VLTQWFGVLGGDRKLEALCFCGMRGERIEDGLLGLGAEARKLVNLAGLCRLGELLDGFHLQVIVERAHALWPEAGNLEELGDGRR